MLSMHTITIYFSRYAGYAAFRRFDATLIAAIIDDALIICRR